MQPTNLLRAMTILAEHTGKSVATHRDFLRDWVNKIRRNKWKFEAARLLMFKTSGCECAECFTDNCGACSPKFAGITLPIGVVGIHYLEANGVRIDMTNERLGSGGCCVSACGCLKAEMLVKRSPLQRDIPASHKGTVVFVADSPKDKEKRVGVEYVARGCPGKVIREDIPLDLVGKTTSQSPLRFEKITLPERCGWVKVQTSDGYQLGAYHPSITAPSHYRIRLSGVAAGNLVAWEGLKEPLDAIFDTDLVEWDNPLEWENDYQFLTLHFNTNKTPAERDAYAASASLSQAGVDSELSATQPVPSATLRPTGVHNFRRRMRWLQRL